jgi:hypothetical protein
MVSDLSLRFSSQKWIFLVVPRSIQGIVIYIFPKEGIGVKVSIRYMNKITC